MGVSMVKLVHTLAKQAEAMEAYKLARFAYGKLQGLKVCLPSCREMHRRPS